MKKTVTTWIAGCDNAGELINGSIEYGYAVLTKRTKAIPVCIEWGEG
jgi:hypothetical protein